MLITQLVKAMARVGFQPVWLQNPCSSFYSAAALAGGRGCVCAGRWGLLSMLGGGLPGDWWGRSVCRRRQS